MSLHRNLLRCLMIGGACLSACGETSESGEGANPTSATGGSDAGVATGTAAGTGGAAATVTNAMAAANTGNVTTGTGGASTHCHTLEEVQRELDRVGWGPLAAGQAGAPALSDCPEYYPSIYGPPCGGELVSQSAELVCCYSFVECN